MKWLLAPLAAIPMAVVAMVLTIAVVMPASVVLSAGVRAYARRRPRPDETRTRRFSIGALLGLMAMSTWTFAFERSGRPDLPMVVPAVVALGLLALAQVLCCIGLLRHAPRERPEWTILGCMLLWGGVGTAMLAYGMHRGAMPGSM